MTKPKVVYIERMTRVLLLGILGEWSTLFPSEDACRRSIRRLAEGWERPFKFPLVKITIEPLEPEKAGGKKKGKR